MYKDQKATVLSRLLINSRFWILISGIVFSVCIAGVVQLLIPSSALQVIRIEQIYGFIAIFLLIIALLASPLTKLYPKLPFNNAYLHARRAFGVLTFYYALLHGLLAFTKQLGGFEGVKYYNDEYRWSLFLGLIALSILFIMAATSMDWVIRVVSFKRWKLLHRLVYLAGASVLIHIALIGSHFETINLASTFTGVAVAALLWFQWLRIRRGGNDKTKKDSGR